MLRPATETDVLPPGPRRPRAQQTLEWLLGSHRVMDRNHARYGDVFTTRILPVVASQPGARTQEGDWVFLADPELVKQVFTADPAVVRTGRTNRFLEGVVGAGSILLSDEPEHMEQRRILLPPFHGDRVEAYRGLIDEIARAELARWPSGEMRLWPRMQAITLDVIVRAVFGITDAERRRRMHVLLRDMLNRLTSARWVLGRTALTVATQGWATPRDPVRRMLAPVDAALVEEIRLRRGAPPGDDILSMLLDARREDGSPLSDAQLRDELMTLLIAGHESTATMLAWAFERLVRHPGRLKRLREEAEDGGDEYADAVVKETLRLRPVLPVVLRELTEPMELGGHSLPAGTWVAPCGYLIHRRADIYPDPLAFRPERFVGSRAGTYEWIPFGGGVRRCAGAAFAQLEMKQVLQTVVTALDLEPVDLRSELMRPRFVTLAPARGATVRARPRRVG